MGHSGTPPPNRTYHLARSRWPLCRLVNGVGHSLPSRRVLYTRPGLRRDERGSPSFYGLGGLPFWLAGRSGFSATTGAPLYLLHSASPDALTRYRRRDDIAQPPPVAPQRRLCGVFSARQIARRWGEARDSATVDACDVPRQDHRCRRSVSRVRGGAVGSLRRRPPRNAIYRAHKAAPRVRAMGRTRFNGALHGVGAAVTGPGLRAVRHGVPLSLRCRLGHRWWRAAARGAEAIEPRSPTPGGASCCIASLGAAPAAEFFDTCAPARTTATEASTAVAAGSSATPLMRPRGVTGGVRKVARPVRGDIHGRLTGDRELTRPSSHQAPGQDFTVWITAATGRAGPRLVRGVASGDAAIASLRTFKVLPPDPPSRPSPGHPLPDEGDPPARPPSASSTAAA